MLLGEPAQIEAQEEGVGAQVHAHGQGTVVIADAGRSAQAEGAAGQAAVVLCLTQGPGGEQHVGAEFELQRDGVRPALVERRGRRATERQVAVVDVRRQRVLRALDAAAGAEGETVVPIEQVHGHGGEGEARQLVAQPGLVAQVVLGGAGAVPAPRVLPESDAYAAAQVQPLQGTAGQRPQDQVHLPLLAGDRGQVRALRIGDRQAARHKRRPCREGERRRTLRRLLRPRRGCPGRKEGGGQDDCRQGSAKRAVCAGHGPTILSSLRDNKNC